MSIIEDVVKGVVSPLTAPLDVIKEIVGKFSSGKDKLDAELALAKIEDEKAERESQLLAAQIELNKIDAQSMSFWNSGWRPGIGWTCALCLFLFYVPQFVIASIFWVIVFCKTGTIAPYPINPDSLIQLICGMLGMAAFRTYEKSVNIRK